MWHLDHELIPWFERVRDKRGLNDTRETVPMSENEDPRVAELRARTGR